MERLVRGLVIFAMSGLPLVGLPVQAHETGDSAVPSALAERRANLVRNAAVQGSGPQSPRDLTRRAGANLRASGVAPPASRMNLCNIHFHRHAEHRGGEFLTFAGLVDGSGESGGYRFSGHLTEAESRPIEVAICAGHHGGLQVGDTIELHYAHSTARVVPGPTLNACLSEGVANPQLRVEAQVLVLVNDPRAADFTYLTATGEVDGYQQALNLPPTGEGALHYQGSTTGPAYNEKGSPLHVSWTVRPQVIKVHAESVGRWCQSNIFREDHAHGVRDLVTDESLLSPMD